MESSFTFLRVRGIPIGAHWTWLFFFALICWSLASALFPRTYPGLAPASYVVMGVTAAVLFYVSILLHELGHAFRALREGMRIEGITLWLLGGVARFTGMFPSAGAEFRIAIAGPVVSVAIAAIFAAITVAANAAGAPASVRGVTDYLARLNAIVVGFNLVPALPLDGGRVLRAWLWHRQRSFSAATRSASRAGRAFGVVLMGVGLLGFFTGAGTGGVWFVFLGWFLVQAAGAEQSVAVLRSALGGVRVRDLMTPDPEVVTADTPLDRFFGLPSRHSTYPVVRDGVFAGLVSVRQAAGVPPEARAASTVSDVMIPAGDVPMVGPDTPVLDAIEVLRGGPGRALVMVDGRVEGIISTSDVAKALEWERARGVAEEPGVRPAGIAVWIVVGSMMAVAAAALYHPPVAVISPGVAVDVAPDIRIEGAPAQRPSGRYLLTSVRLGQPSAIGVLIAMARGEDVLSLDRVVPRGVDTDQYLERQKELFRESRQIAAAAAARAVGMNVTIDGGGARVVQIARGSPAAGVLREGDVISAIDGTPVRIAQDVGVLIGARPAGSTFTLTIKRGSQTREVSLRSALLDRTPDEVARIGVFVETRDLDVKLPFEVKFRDRDVAGPSAGLAYALAVADILDPADIARGRTVAATGTIDLEGRVGEVGGVEAKADTALRRRADLFLVPADEVDDARSVNLNVRGVGSLSEALASLK